MSISPDTFEIHPQFFQELRKNARKLPWKGGTSPLVPGKFPAIEKSLAREFHVSLQTILRYSYSLSAGSGPRYKFVDYNGEYCVVRALRPEEAGEVRRVLKILYEQQDHETHA